MTTEFLIRKKIRENKVENVLLKKEFWSKTIKWQLNQPIKVHDQSNINL